MVRGITLPDNVRYAVNESQYTGPANQSEPMAYLGGSGIMETGSQPAIQITMRTKVKYMENKAFVFFKRSIKAIVHPKKTSVHLQNTI